MLDLILTALNLRAVNGAHSPSSATYQDFYDIAVERCITGRGYRVLNPVTDGS